MKNEKRCIKVQELEGDDCSSWDWTGLTRILVYGALRRGGSNHSMMVNGGAVFEYLMTITGYKLFRLEGAQYPVVIKSGNSHDKIQVESYLVDGALLGDLLAMELYVGYKMVAAGEPYSYMFVYDKEFDQQRSEYIPDGDWISYTVFERINSEVKR